MNFVDHLLFYMKLLNYLFCDMFGSVLECYELTHISWLSTPGNHAWVNRHCYPIGCVIKSPHQGICSCSPIVNFFKFTFHHHHRCTKHLGTTRENRWHHHHWCTEHLGTTWKMTTSSLACQTSWHCKGKYVRESSFIHSFASENIQHYPYWHIYHRIVLSESVPRHYLSQCLLLMPLSHCCEFCLRTNTNWHSLHIAQHRIDSNYFVLVRCHSRISSQANTNVLKCSKHSYWPCESKPIRIASYCIAEHCIKSCQFLWVYISSLYIHIDLLYISTVIPRMSAGTQYVAIRCATIALSYWIAHIRIGSCKFLLVPIVFSSHHSAIVLILHHHRTASYCIVSPSCCILLHLTASYQFVLNSCLIRIDSQIIIVSNRSGSA